MLVKTLKRAGLGFFIGVFVGNVIAVLSGWPDAFVTEKLLAMTGGQAPAVLVQTLLSGVLGAVGFAGVSLYDLESWPLLRIALVHYVIIEAAFYPIAFALGWMHTAKEALIWLVIYAIVYLVIFLIMWAIYKRQIKEANKLIEHRKQEQTKRHQTGGAL